MVPHFQHCLEGIWEQLKEGGMHKFLHGHVAIPIQVVHGVAAQIKVSGGGPAGVALRIRLQAASAGSCHVHK